MRKEADAKRLQGEFGDFFTPLLFDVTDEAAVHKAAADVKSCMKGHTLLGLINNAGMPLLPPAHSPTISRQFALCRSEHENFQVEAVNLLNMVGLSQQCGVLCRHPCGPGCHSRCATV